jgi:hypothetical protein
MPHAYFIIRATVSDPVQRAAFEIMTLAQEWGA